MQIWPSNDPHFYWDSSNNCEQSTMNGLWPTNSNRISIRSALPCPAAMACWSRIDLFFFNVHMLHVLRTNIYIYIPNITQSEKPKMLDRSVDRLLGMAPYHALPCFTMLCHWSHKSLRSQLGFAFSAPCQVCWLRNPSWLWLWYVMSTPDYLTLLNHDFQKKGVLPIVIASDI